MTEVPTPPQPPKTSPKPTPPHLRLVLEEMGTKMTCLLDLEIHNPKPDVYEARVLGEKGQPTLPLPRFRFSPKRTTHQAIALLALMERTLRLLRRELQT